MLDDRVRAVLARLEAEDEDERVTRTTGQLLFALVAPQNDCGVLEIGGSRGYATIWLAAGVRYFSGRVVSIEHDPERARAWRRNVAEAGLDDWAELEEADAFEALGRIEDVFDVVFIAAAANDSERLFQLAREKVEPGALIVADDVLSRRSAYSQARQADPTLESVTVPLDRGLELTAVLREPL